MAPSNSRARSSVTGIWMAPTRLAEGMPACMTCTRDMQAQFALSQVPMNQSKALYMYFAPVSFCSKLASNSICSLGYFSGSMTPVRKVQPATRRSEPDPSMRHVTKPYGPLSHQIVFLSRNRWMTEGEMYPETAEMSRTAKDLGLTHAS